MYLYISEWDPFALSEEKTITCATYNRDRASLLIELKYSPEYIARVVAMVFDSSGAGEEPSEADMVMASDRLAYIMTQSVREFVDATDGNYTVVVETNLNIYDVVLRRAKHSLDTGGIYDAKEKMIEYKDVLFDWYDGLVEVVLPEPTDDYAMNAYYPAVL